MRKKKEVRGKKSVSNERGGTPWEKAGRCEQGCERLGERSRDRESDESEHRE